MSDTDLLEWLNHWLVSFAWSPANRLCTLMFQDPYGHPYKATGKDLRECITNALAAHPSSATFIGLPRE